MRKILLILLSLTMMSACSSAKKAEFVAKDANIVIDGKTLTPGMDYTDPLIKNWDNYEEMESCAYIGTDRIYYYSGYTLFTFPEEGKDYILEIELAGSMETSKGIKIGSSFDEVKTKYGDGYESKGLTVVYTADLLQLIFNIVDNKVTKIRLKYITE